MTTTTDAKLQALHEAAAEVRRLVALGAGAATGTWPAALAAYDRRLRQLALDLGCTVKAFDYGGGATRRWSEAYRRRVEEAVRQRGVRLAGVL